MHRWVHITIHTVYVFWATWPCCGYSRTTWWSIQPYDPSVQQHIRPAFHSLAHLDEGLSSVYHFFSKKITGRRKGSVATRCGSQGTRQSWNDRRLCPMKPCIIYKRFWCSTWFLILHFDIALSASDGATTSLAGVAGWACRFVDLLFQRSPAQ